MASKKILIVFSHHDHRSLNGAMLETATTTLKAQGHTVTVSDLYAMKFNPLVGRHDVVGGPAEGDIYKVTDETSKAFLEGRMADDIKAEQQKVMEADMIIFQFPMYWMNLPAMLKGYLDRVFTSTFAYTPRDSCFDKGKMLGKKAMLSFTLGAPEIGFSPSGVMGDMELWLWHMQYSVLRFMGFDVLAPNIAYGIDTREKADDLVAAWKTRLESLMSETPLSFPALEMFQGPTLTKEAKEKAIGKGESVSVGHHLGFALPSGTMMKAQ